MMPDLSKPAYRIVQFDAYITWTDRDGYETASRPQRREQAHEARNAAVDIAERARRAGATNVDARVFQVEFEITTNRDGDTTWREIGRLHLATLSESGDWVRFADQPRAPRLVMETWLNVMRDTNTSGPALPPEDVKRAGPQAISDWYRARMDASEADAVARHRAVINEINDAKAKGEL